MIIINYALRTVIIFGASCCGVSTVVVVWSLDSSLDWWKW